MIFAALEKRGGRQRKSGDCEKFNLTSLKIDSFGCKIRFASHYIARVKGVFFSIENGFLLLLCCMCNFRRDGVSLFEFNSMFMSYNCESLFLVRQIEIESSNQVNAYVTHRHSRLITHADRVLSRESTYSAMRRDSTFGNFFSLSQNNDNVQAS